MRMQSLALALTAAVLAMPAAAAEDQRSRLVHYGDLDLATAAGQEQLDIRLERAAREVCRVNAPVTGSHLRSPNARKCYEEARRDLDRQYAQLVTRRSTAGG